MNGNSTSTDTRTIATGTSQSTTRARSISGQGVIASAKPVLIYGVIPICIVTAAVWSFVPRGGASGARTEPLPVVGMAPEFTLTERSGRAVARDDLRGQVWIADFIFTRCAGPCPELSLRMESLQKSLAGKHSDVKLISFSLDPEYDTPAVLEKYAEKYNAQRDRWWFLTGADETTMHAIVQRGFLQSVLRTEGGGEIVHSTYFVLVDRAGRIRGFYEGLEGDSKPKILRDVDALRAEPFAQ